MFRVAIGFCVSLCLVTSANAGIRTWGFDDGTLQGWEYTDIFGDPFPVGDPTQTDVGWKVSIDDVALGENPEWFLLQGSTVDGPGTPGVNNHPDYFPPEEGARSRNYRVIPEPWDNRDCLSGLECMSQILRSPTFKLDDSGPISVDIMGGQAQGERSFNPDTDDPPFFPDDLDFVKSGSGWQGFALYEVANDEYVRWGFPSFNNDGKVRDDREVWETVSIPQEDLADLANDAKDYQVHIFDSYSGGWGWIGFDTVRVPDAELSYEWTGGGEDNLWSNSNNWDHGVPNSAGGEVRVNAPAAGGVVNGPVIQDGIEASAGILISDSGEAAMTMSGGTLELTDWGMWWGDAEGSTATFEMSGGTINFTGSPGIMELAWQPDDAPVGSSVGIWNMTGGEINAKGIDMPGDGEDGNPGRAEISLRGGTINVGTARGGLMMYEGGKIDIQGDGRLVLEGEQPQVEDYIANDWITAYQGAGDVVLDFDGAFTTLTATLLGLPGDCNADGVVDIQDANCTHNDALDDFLAALDPPSLRGDADGDGEVQFSDFVILSENFASPGDYTSGDFDKDGEVQFSDFVILSENFGQAGGEAAATVPEPSGLALLELAALLTTGLCRRRRATAA